jgi:hypothetical protein
LQFVELWSQFSPRHQLKEELDFVLMGRRYYRIGALAAFVCALDAKRGVLARPELEFAARIYADAPKKGRKVNSLGYRCVIKLAVGAHNA